MPRNDAAAAGDEHQLRELTHALPCRSATQTMPDTEIPPPVHRISLGREGRASPTRLAASSTITMRASVTMRGGLAKKNHGLGELWGPFNWRPLALGMAPAALASSFVLGVYADTGALLYELVRPLVTSIGIAVSMQIVLSLALRSVTAGSYLALLLVAMTVISKRLLLVGIAVMLVALYARRRGWRLDIQAPLVAIIALLFLLSVVRVATSEAFNLGDLVVRPTGSGTAEPGSPDIFLIMLDGYPRSDTLASFGYDNSWFENELAERGFRVSSASTTSYPYTGLTVATMLNMEHLPDIEGLYPAPDTHVGQTRALLDVANNSPVLSELEDRGYWTVSAGLTEVRGAIRNVDEYIDGGEIRLWERQVLQRTTVWPQLCEMVVIPQHRSLIESTFAAITNAGAEGRDGQTFMFAHVMSPHTPIVFDSEGRPATVRGSGDCAAQFGIDVTSIGLGREVFEHAMAEQVHYLNNRTIDALDSLIANKPEAVVVIFSDHGARHSGEVADEWFRNFFAARTPGREDVFGDDVRPIDIFPRLFGEYFGLAIPTPDGRSFTSTHGILLPLDLTEWR